MKKLKKILLINWLYFSKELIEVGDVNFLTGKNGAGKSTVIDALQIVLLGETSPRNFNQAANEKSQRTLDGYLRADMDENNPYSRRGKDFSSYIACEFQDEVEGTSFVTGVVFDCRSDGSRQERFFIYVGTLPENCFIENDAAMEIPALRRYLKQNYARAEIYDTQKEYRRNMLSRWNVHNEQVLRMMKKAVSFRPIVDIQKFITENICDIPDKPDIEAMQQNIRDYKRHELLAQRQEEKLAALQGIGRLYREMHQAIDRWQVQSFLVLWAQKEIRQSQIQHLEQEKADCTANLTAAKERIREITTQITQKEDRRRELELACAQSSVFQEEEKLRGRKQALLDEREQLHREMQSLAQEIKKEALRLNNLCSAILEQEAEENLLPVQDAAQGGLAQAAMEQVLEEAEYRPGAHISNEKYAESGLGLPKADNMCSSGLVCGKYHGCPLEISNLELSNTLAYQNPETEVWEDRELPIFKGQWMAADLGRSISCNVQVAPKGKLARLLGRDSFNSENPEFDRRFSIQCDNPAAVQSVLSPRVMDQLLKMGSVYLSVKADGRVFAAIQTDELLFDAGKGRPEGLTQRFADQLRVFTDLLDALKG